MNERAYLSLSTGDILKKGQAVLREARALNLQSSAYRSSGLDHMTITPISLEPEIVEKPSGQVETRPDPKKLIDLSPFFDGISEDKKEQHKLERLTELLIENDKTQIVITKPREIISEDNRILYSRFAIVKTDAGLSYFEMYGNTENLEQIRENIEQVTFQEPAILSQIIYGSQDMYEPAYEKGQLVINMIDPTHISVFKATSQIKSVDEGEDIHHAAEEFTTMFFNHPISTEIPSGDHLDQYIHHNEIFQTEFALSRGGYRYEFAAAHPHEDVTFGTENLSTTLNTYRVRCVNEETGKLEKLIRVISNIPLDEQPITEPILVRPDTYCFCETNTDGYCGCRQELVNSLKQATEQNKPIIVALDTQGTARGNGALNFYEQALQKKNFKGEKSTPTYEPLANALINAYGYSDERDFTHQARILLGLAERKATPSLEVVAKNGKKMSSMFEQQEKLNLSNIHVAEAEEFYQKVLDTIPATASGLVDHAQHAEYSSRRDERTIELAKKQPLPLTLPSRYGEINFQPQTNEIYINLSQLSDLERIRQEFPAWINGILDDTIKAKRVIKF